ncbi:MAG TPA: acyltransferase family protein, partial [Acetobacteraceae bacterium]|nr:acyltransferase family protein [Acetobacteraceae bacterium]
MPGSVRNFGLDLARALAITSVLLSHFLLEPANGVPILRTALVYAGGAGVELFFSLSGFLIGGLLLDLAQRGLSPRSVAAFWFRRWMRTLPLYYAVLWLTGWWFGHQDPHAWLFLQNFHPDEPRLVPASWSLVLEEYFYLFFPSAMLLLSAAVGGAIRLVASVALLLVAVCTAGRLANAYGVFHLGW